MNRLTFTEKKLRSPLQLCGREFAKQSNQLEKNMKRMSFACVWSLSLAVLVAGTGPTMGLESRGDNPTVERASAGQLEATRTFWNAFQLAADAGHGVEVLGQNAWTANMSEDDVSQVLADIALAERQRSLAISSLPVVHVDPVAVAFAADYVSVKAEFSNLIDEGLLLLKRQQEILSLSSIGGGLLLGFLAHHTEEGDGALLGAALDQVGRTAGQLSELKAPAEALEDRVGRALGCLVKLQADQMGIRSSLSSRYGIEFDAVKSVVKVNRKLEMRRLVEKEIAQSLVGESAGGWFDSWTFESQKEFVSLKILNVSDRSDVLQDYVVSVHVKRG
jgi:hypothetical protein